MYVKRLFSTTALSGLLYFMVQSVYAEPIENNTTLQRPEGNYAGFDGSTSNKRALYFRETSNPTDALTGSVNAGATSDPAEVQSWNGLDAFDAFTEEVYLAALSSPAPFTSEVDITLYLTRQTSTDAESLSIDAVGLWSETDDEITNSGSILIDATAGDTTSSTDAFSKADATGIQGENIQNTGDITLWARGGNAKAGSKAFTNAEATGLIGTNIENSGKISITALAGNGEASTGFVSADAYAYGIRGDLITNHGELSVTASTETGTIQARGLYAYEETVTLNTGDITISGTAGDNAQLFGIYAYDGTVGTNTGDINVIGVAVDGRVQAAAIDVHGGSLSNNEGTLFVDASSTHERIETYGIRATSGQVGTNTGNITVLSETEDEKVEAYGISSGTLDLNSGDIHISAISRDDIVRAYAIEAETTKNTGSLEVSSRSTKKDVSAYGIKGQTETNEGSISISATSEESYAYSYGIQGVVDTNTGLIEVESTTTEGFAYAHGIQGNTQKNEGDIRAEATAVEDYAYAFGIQNGVTENIGDIHATARSTEEQAYAYSIQGGADTNTGDLVTTSVSKNSYAYAYGIQGEVTTNSGNIQVTARGAQQAFAYGVQGNTAANLGALTVSALSTNDYAQAFGISGAVNTNDADISVEAFAGTDNYSTFARAYGLHSYQSGDTPDNISRNSGDISVVAAAGDTDDTNGNIHASAKAYGIFLEAYNADDPIYGAISENHGNIEITVNGAELAGSSDINEENGRVDAIGVLANVGTNTGDIKVAATGSSIEGASKADLIVEAYGIRGNVATNSGTVWVKAVAGTNDGGTVSSYVQTSGLRGTVGTNNGDVTVHGASSADYVHAYGIDTYKGDLTANSGSINVTGISGTDHVQASGIDIYEGDIGTNSGAIEVYGQSEQRYVQATGIDIFQGSIDTNSGKISARGFSKESYVQSTGIDLTDGNLTTNTGDIYVKAVSEQDYTRAKGIDGPLDNNHGAITSISIAQADYSRAYGIYDFDGGSTPSDLTENTGIIEVLAESGDIVEADRDINSTAEAYGIQLTAFNSDDPIRGTIAKNTGDITVFANGGLVTGTSNTHNADATVQAYGVQANITENTGHIYVEANGTSANNLSNGDLLTRAYGIDGDVEVNSGNITVFARAGTSDTGTVNTGTYAYGINGATGINEGQIHVESHSEDFVYATGLNDVVSLENREKVTALATSKDDFVYATGIAGDAGAEVTKNSHQVHAKAESESRFSYAYGIRADVGENSGDIIAQAISGTSASSTPAEYVYAYSVSGGLESNSAIIKADATSYGDQATAYGVAQASGTLTNTGVISAMAQSISHGGDNDTANAYGIYLKNDLALDSQGLILASASGDTDSKAYQVYTDGFDLSIENYGMLLGSDLQLTDYEGTIQSDTGNNVTFDNADLYVYVDPVNLREGEYTLPSLVENKTLTEGQFEDFANIDVLRSQLGTDWTVGFVEQTGTAGEQKIIFNYAPESSAALVSAAATRQMALNLQNLVDGQLDNLWLNSLSSSINSEQSLNSYAPVAPKSEGLAAINKAAPSGMYGDGFEQTTQVYMQGVLSQQAANYDPVGYNVYSQGLLVGLNSTITENILVGASGYYGQGKLDFTGNGFESGSEDIKNYAAGVQASYQYGSALLGLSSLYTHSENDFANATSTGSRTGSFTTDTLTTRLALKYKSELTGNRFTPEVALTHVWFKQDDFTTSGTSHLDTRYSNLNENDLYLSANLGWNRDFNLGEWVVQPNAKLGVLHALTSNEVAGEVYQAAAVEELVFGADRTYLNTSAGLTLTSGNFSASLNYAGSFSKNTSRNTVQGRFSLRL